MHIGFLTPEYPPGPCGGIGTSIHTLAHRLAGLGHRVTVLGWGPGGTRQDGGVSVRFRRPTRIPQMGWLLNRWGARREFQRLVAHEGLEILEAPDWCGLSAGVTARCASVVRCHGSATYFADLLRDRVRPALRWAEGIALHQASGVAAVSAFTARQTARLFELPRPVEVIHNGIDVSRFTAGPGTGQGGERVLYFGTLVRKKGVLDLPEIFRRLWRIRPQARLVLVGRDAPDRTTGAPSTWQLIREAVPPADRGKVEYLGPRAYHEMPEQIHAASVCIFPSYAEAFPMAWLEAMACARPVVAYGIGWACEVVESGRSGWLVPLGDYEAFAQTLAGVLRGPEEAGRVGQAARARVEERFSLDLVTQKTLAWYRQCGTVAAPAAD